MNILVWVGGFVQIYLINELNYIGHETVLVDYFNNPLKRFFSANN